MLQYLSADVNCLFQEASSFPGDKLKEKCELQETDNTQGKISENFFMTNGSCCVYIFFVTCWFFPKLAM